MAEDPVAPDATLVKGARLGDAAAFDALVRRYARPAYAIALSMVGDDDDAADICQDVFVRVIERLEDCRSLDRFGAWFFAVVRSTAHNHRRREQRRRGAPLDESGAISGDSPSRNVERGELRARLAAALGQLSRVESEVVLLHDLEGWTHQAIAKALGISEVGSRQHLFVARRSLRERLADLQLHNTDHD
jgi:RNA polymerase sigma-70 factor (ECF subfamily)